MDKQKQIEEMAKVIHNSNEHRYADWIDYTNADLSTALKLYKAGYRKIPEGAVVLTRGEHQKYLAFKIIEPQVRGCLDRERELEKRLETIRKDTAEKFADKFRYIYTDYIDEDVISVCGLRFWIDEICKEITEGK